MAAPAVRVVGAGTSRSARCSGGAGAPSSRLAKTATSTSSRRPAAVLAWPASMGAAIAPAAWANRSVAGRHGRAAARVSRRMVSASRSRPPHWASNCSAVANDRRTPARGGAAVVRQPSPPGPQRRGSRLSPGGRDGPVRSGGGAGPHLGAPGDGLLPGEAFGLSRVRARRGRHPCLRRGRGKLPQLDAGARQSLQGHPFHQSAFFPNSALVIVPDRRPLSHYHAQPITATL